MNDLELCLNAYGSNTIASPKIPLNQKVNLTPALGPTAAGTVPLRKEKEKSSTDGPSVRIEPLKKSYTILAQPLR